jgi:hypothetical protein
MSLEEMRKKAEPSIFTPSEEADFSNIYKTFQREEEICFTLVARTQEGVKGNSEEKRIFCFKVSLETLVPKIDEIMKNEYRESDFQQYFLRLFSLEKIDQKFGMSFTKQLDLFKDLNLYGFLEYAQKSRGSGGGFSFSLKTHDIYVFSPKLQRFKYWLKVKNIIHDNVKWAYTGTEEWNTIIASLSNSEGQV